MTVEEKIKEYERLGLFDKDVENDPETIQLTPDKVDYLLTKPFAKLQTKIANQVAKAYYEREIRRGDMVIEGVNGIENYLALKGGVILTCNHFSPYDNYAIDRTLQPYLKKNRLYKVIKEGNFTNFKGLFGYFFRHCNTLPLSSNIQTMRKFLNAVSVLLKRGEKILIYPEQSMWMNYKKPRPLKSGAFNFAVKFDVPVLPVFITLKEVKKKNSDKMVYAYTLHFLPAIYPDKSVSSRESQEIMANKNYQAWKEVYENVYKIPLTYGGN